MNTVMDKSGFDFDTVVKSGLLKEEQETQVIEQCFSAFTSVPNKGLSISDFQNLIEKLFLEPKNGKRFSILKNHIEQVFTKFDVDKDGFISRNEFNLMWNKWMKIILWPKSALLIVDVQNDFISGSLSLSKCPAQHKGEDVVPVINRLVKEVPFTQILYTYDWHPDNHISFIENVKMRKVIEINGKPISETNSLDKLRVLEAVTFEGPPKVEQIMWPKHCVQNTIGSQLHSDLIVDKNAVNIYKGMNPDIDSYSGFWDNGKQSETLLNQELKNRGITDVYVCGIAYDVCVQCTANHSLEYGYRTAVINDASRGVDIEGIRLCKEALINKHCVIVESNEVDSMVKGLNRRFELAYFLALQL